MKLTSEQSKMVAENHNLIYWYINRRALDEEEWYDLLAIELCTSVLNYNPERGGLSTFFKRNCDNLVAKEYLRSKYQKNAHNGHVEIMDHKHHAKADDVDVLMDLDELLEGPYGHILKLRVEGYTQAEIAEKIGVTQSYVSQTINKIRKEYYETN